MQDPPGNEDNRPPSALEAMQANTNEVEALRLTNQRLIGELEQLTRKMQRPREARQAQEGHNFPPHEGQHNLDIPRGVEQKQSPAEPGGMDRNWPLGRRETKQHSKDMSGMKNYVTLSQEQSWEQRFKSLQQELSLVKEVVRGRALDTMEILVQ